MEKKIKNFMINCFSLNILFGFFLILLVTMLETYKHKEIPSYVVETFKRNLESTPIFDILIDEQCDYNNNSNILGYFYGFGSGFIYENKFYSNEKKKYTVKIQMIAKILNLQEK